MKKLFSNLVLVLVITTLAHSQATRPGERRTPNPRVNPQPSRRQQQQQQQQQPLATEVTYQRACIAVGAQGTVLVSTNDGASWQPGNIGVNQKFGGIAHLNNLNFLTVGRHKIYRSFDAGSTWIKCTFDKLTPEVLQTFNAVATDGKARVVAVGQFLKTGSGAMLDRGLIQYSTDGGATFKLAVSELNSPLAAVAYTGNNTFVAAGGGLLMCSTDGGVTWRDVTYTNTNVIYRRPTDTSSPAPIWNIADIAASTTGRVLAVGGGSFNIMHMPGVAYYSADTGLTWFDTNYSNKPEYIKGVATNDKGMWIAVGTNVGQYIKSTDNGVSWSQYVAIDTDNYWLGAITHVDGDRWVAVGANGKIVITIDNGATWVNINSPTSKSLYDVVCASVQ